VPENLKIRQQMARAIMERKHAWADKANRIRQEVTVLKNYFVFYHVLLNETRVDYEFEAYTDLAVDMINAKTDVRVSERSHNLEALLKNLDQTIEYFKNVSYVENVCVGLSIKFEILHYRGDMEAANKVLSELETIIETYDLKQLQPKFEALRNGGTTHEKMAKFKADQNAHNRRLQEEHNAMVRDMKNLDALDAQRMLMVDQPDTIGLYPIGHFQFSRTERNRVYDILQISERVRSTFDQMWDIDKIIPVANIYHNPITHEGHWDGQILNTSIEAWRNIYAVRKAFFDNGFPRIVLKFGKTDNF
jgi:hypothetical protein